jgi:ribosomal protein S18 acetylase RimI-like enzyme
MIDKKITYRRQIKKKEVKAIERIVRSSGFFSAAEIALAIELAEEKIAQGNSSSYEFLLGESANLIVAYTCFGLIPATTNSYDLYWIAVDEQFRKKGYGKEIMLKTEEIIYSMGGKHIYAETSSRDLYLPTHIFYENCGYMREAFLKDFYAEGDDKIIYSKAFK